MTVGRGASADALDEVLLDLLQRAGAEGEREALLRLRGMSAADLHRWIDRTIDRGYIERSARWGPFPDH